MTTPPRIYLDNAATSWPKPESVYRAVDRYQREVGAPAGRSGYTEASEVSRLVEQARMAVARILGVKDSACIAFCHNGTDALNAAIHGALRDGGHVVTSDAEHNSVLRPLALLAAQGRISLNHVPCDSAGRIDPADVRRALRPGTRLVAIQHASNVTGTIQPLAEVGKAVRSHGALFLVDAAQTLGHLPFTVDDLHCDLLAAPGHKGLMGPLGTGVLYVRPGVEAHLQSFRQGGTGTNSESDEHPGDMPDKFEAGNLNVPGIAGLRAGCDFLLERGIARLHTTISGLVEHFCRRLQQIDGVKLYGSDGAEDRVGVVSLNIQGYDPQDVAASLDTAYRIQVRAGLHCAARIHHALHTFERGGTVRFSVGPFNTAEEIAVAAEAVGEIAAAARVL
ncbi:MAG: aminotransferase class V-fold PLP-dependent enzyme [Pirellulales bacterium]